MPKILPFNAILPSAELAAEISSLPYDVMNREEAKEMAAGSPLNFLHVTRSEIDLPDSVDAYDGEVYKTAAKNWKKLREEFLVKDTLPAFYVYSQVMDGRRQTGVVATPLVADYNAGIIKKHETTRKAKEDDRTRHISTLRAQTGPVFLTYRDSAAINDIVARAMRQEPLFQFTSSDGISHEGWRVSDEDMENLQKAFLDVPALYIADGHHRAASASRTAEALQNDGESDRFLAGIFPAGDLKILPYNRVLLDLNGLSEEQFLDALRKVAPLTENAQPSPDRPGLCSLYLKGVWYSLQLPAPKENTPIGILDVSRLQDFILQPILGIDDPRTSPRIDFVGGIRGTAELEKLVNNGTAKAAFSMYPTTVEQLMAIADANAIMPPKSTWFEPKLRDGLFVHEI